MKGAAVGFPPQWNRDPKTGITAPLRYGKSIDYRDNNLVGDIKYLWEPSRHLDLVTLAQAWRLTGEARYAEACRHLLDSWFTQCPYPMGVHWTSSLELALRLLNWYFAWHLLGGDASVLFEGTEGQTFRQRWQVSIYQHCHFIAGHLSLHSSANNHLLGEYMGLLVGSIGWPLWPQSRAWRDVAVRGFEQQALSQNACDGVNLEQATYYHHEVADMMILCGLIGRTNGIEFSEAYWDRLESMLVFIGAIMDSDGHVPMIGDADDAQMVRLSPQRDVSPYRSLLATGAVLFDSAAMARQAGHFDDKSRWLLGDAAEQQFISLRDDPRANHQLKVRERVFPLGGYYLLGQNFGQPDEALLVADAGPLGYLSIAAHGHADALSFTLNVAGQEVLIDPGTYAYHAQKKWRDYFRGTSAHNTVRVDGVDQSVSGGNFLWTTHARARCEAFETDELRDRFVGSHDGYGRLPDPVVHRREIVFDKATWTIDVFDTLSCTTTHDVELFWHFAEGCRVELDSVVVLVDCGRSRLSLSMTALGFAVELLVGRESSPLGWVSRSLDHKVPTTTVRWHGRIAAPTTLHTRLVLRLATQTT
jgi:hypothetical protein